MEAINSISEISRVYETGNAPVSVLAEDLNEYICKYSMAAPSRMLLVEYLGFEFANIWGIPIPPGRFIKILDEHVPNAILGGRIQKVAFEKTTIGSLIYSESREIDKTVILSWKSKKSQLKKIINKNDFLKIALFDLWLANEDRNHNNCNLLVTPFVNGQKIIAIDHEKCFNSGNIDNGQTIYSLTEHDSILNSEITGLLFRQGPELNATVDELMDQFPDWVNACQAQLAEILDHIPASWGINRGSLVDYLNNNIFVAQWRAAAEQDFREYLLNSFVNPRYT